MKTKEYRAKNYTMKCRMYPNKAQASCIDRIIRGVQAAYNMSLHDMLENHMYTREIVSEDGKVSHFADFYALCSKGHLDKLRNENPLISHVPAYALSGKNGVFKRDMKKALCHKWIPYQDKLGNTKYHHDKTANKDKKGHYLPYSLELAKPRFYNMNHPRTSYTYQEKLYTKLKPSTQNRNVIYTKLSYIGETDEQGKFRSTPVKIRGWNRKLRFGSSRCDFVEYISQNKKTTTITVSRDNLGQYWICFRLPEVWISMEEPEEGINLGVDVGVKDILVTSEGDKMPNKYFKKACKKQIRRLSRKISRRSGWTNAKFRELHDQDKTLTPSKGYLKAKKKLGKLHQRIANRRKNYNNQITHDVIQSAGPGGMIGIESLNVAGMLQNRHLASALSDANMSEVLRIMKYKGDYYNREIIQIGRFTPSTKVCHNCGYKINKLSLSVRKWTCPSCGMHHDRDINAAINIRNEAEKIYRLKKNNA